MTGPESECFDRTVMSKTRVNEGRVFIAAERSDAGWTEELSSRKAGNRIRTCERGDR